MSTVTDSGTIGLETRPATLKPLPANGLREVGLAALIAVLISLPIFVIGGWLIISQYAEREAVWQAFVARKASHGRLVASPAGPELAVATLVRGRDLFESTCVACHGMDGKGVEGLGKDLTQSWFVASLDDAALREFVTRGRGVGEQFNTTKIPMPPKGGHEELTDADLANIITYVRGLQDPRRMPVLPMSALAAAAAAPPTANEKTQALALAGGDAELAEFIAHGSKLFIGTCSACHGKDARGLPKLGKDLVASEFCKKLDDDGMLAFLKRGRDTTDPLNTSQTAMPPKGGNPALSDDDLLDVISYVRSLQKQAGAQ